MSPITAVNTTITRGLISEGVGSTDSVMSANFHFIKKAGNSVKLEKYSKTNKSAS